MVIKRLFYIQNGLSSDRGHWLRETLEWKNAAHRLSLEWHGFAHSSFDKKLATLHEVQPVFPYRPHDYIVVEDKPEQSQRSTLTLISAAFAQACSTHLPKDISGQDLLFVANATQKEMLGIAQWLDSVSAPHRPKVAFYFHHLNAPWKVNSINGSTTGDVTSSQLVGKAILQRLPPEKINLYAAVPPLAEVLTAIFGIPAKAMGTTVKSFTHTPTPYRDKKYDVAIMGGARKEQGIDIAVATMAELAALRPDLRALVQIRKPEEAGGLKNITPDSGIEIYCGHLFEDDFNSRLGESRFLLLPYMPDRYCLRESGVFCEASVMGIPVAASEFSSMARHIQAGNAAGIVFNYSDPPAAIAKKLDIALKNGETFYQKSQELSHYWKTQCSAVTSLQRIIDDFSKGAVKKAAVP
jgi:glycosyltransferase involved in cell wall biosynthesis